MNYNNKSRKVQKQHNSSSKATPPRASASKVADYKVTAPKVAASKAVTSKASANDALAEPAGAASRRQSRCPVSGRCGGCSMIDTPIEEQLQQKQALVEACIGRFAQNGPGRIEPIIRMKNPGRYRNKVTAVCGLDAKGHPVYGNYKAGSREIVPVKDCLIENRIADHIVKSIWELLPSFRIRVYDDVTRQGMLRAVQIRAAHATGQYMVTLVTNGPAFPSKQHFVEALLRKEPEINTIIQNINERTDAMILGPTERTLYGPGYIEDILCGCRFRISSRAFYQVNSLQTEKLYNIAIDMAGLSGKEKVIDAYCGIGTIGIIAAGKAREVRSVEQNEDAVRDALWNIKANQLTNVEVVSEDAGAFMTELAEAAESRESREASVSSASPSLSAASPCDVLFMDPPRSGASPEFLQSILRLQPRKIIYISCNPRSLEENLQVLCGGNDTAEDTAEGTYIMKKAVPIDMFPFTNEVETAVLLEIRK